LKNLTWIELKAGSNQIQLDSGGVIFALKTGKPEKSIKMTSFSY
jgi:hypothetical protein